MISSLLHGLLGGLAAAVLPGYFWAAFGCRSDGLAERLAWSSAVSVASVPAIALLIARVSGTGVTLGVAVAAIAVVAGTGALACWLRGAATEPREPALPRPRPAGGLALACVTGACGLALYQALGRGAPGWVLPAVLAACAVAGLVAGRDAWRPGPGAPQRGDDRTAVVRVLRAAGLVAVLALTAVLAYTGPVRHDWPYGRGMDMFSHAVMTEQVLAHGQYGSYLVYPPGFSALSAVICRLAGLPPLTLYPLLAPALVVLTTLGGYALATRLWGWEYGLAAAALSGLVLVGPFQAYSGGLYPDLLDAFFLLVMVVAALVTLYQAASIRTGMLVAVTGAAVVMYHSVGTLYLVLLLAGVGLVCLPYLLLRGREGRALAGRVVLALAALGALSVACAWYVYDLGGFFRSGSTARATVGLDVGSQPVLAAGDLLSWVGSPVIWLGVIGFAALAAAILRLRRPAQVAAALTVLVWCAVMYLGSRTVIDGFPQRFERDVGAPLAVLAALALGLVASSLAVQVRRIELGRLGVAVLGIAAIAGLVAMAAVQVAANLAADGLPSREVLTRAEAAAGAWLARHNTGGTIISTPDLRRGVTNRAVLAMGGYTGLQSYPLQKIVHPRSLPTAGLRPLLDSRYVLFEPASCQAAGIITRDDVRYIILYTPGTEAAYASFRSAPGDYRLAFANAQIAIYAPRAAWLRQCASSVTRRWPAPGSG